MVRSRRRFGVEAERRLSVDAAASVWTRISERTETKMADVNMEGEGLRGRTHRVLQVM